MSFLPYFPAIIGMFVVLILKYFKRITAKKSKSRGKSNAKAPEPSGALPLIGHLHLLVGDQTPAARTLGAMADKYGPVFSLRLGSHQAVVVSGREAFKECFTTHDTIFASRPATATGKYLGYKWAIFALAPYGPFWRHIRKMVTLELLTSHRLEELRHVRESEVNSFLKILHASCGNVGNHQVVAMNKMFESLTMNIIVRKLAGKRLLGGDAEGEREGWHLKEAITRAIYLSGLFVVSDAIPWLEWFDIGGVLKSMKQTFKEIDVVLQHWLEEHIEKRRENGAAGKDDADFMDVMLSTLTEEEALSGHGRNTVIKATAMILILTGSESTAETLTWGLSLLLNNPHALKAAKDELDANVGRDRWVDETDIKNLNYFQAIVKETLRLYPPGPLAGPRQALEDCHVGGYFVPKGTRLIMNLWKIHRDPGVWSNPEEFQPERFLPGRGHDHVGYRGQQHEYVPFSSGRRMCPAVGFGLQVVQLALARLIQGFDITTPAGQPVDMAEGVGLALPKVRPVEVVLAPRLPLKLYQKL